MLARKQEYVGRAEQGSSSFTTELKQEHSLTDLSQLIVAHCWNSKHLTSATFSYVWDPSVRNILLPKYPVQQKDLTDQKENELFGTRK